MTSQVFLCVSRSFAIKSLAKQETIEVEKNSEPKKKGVRKGRKGAYLKQHKGLIKDLQISHPCDSV